MNKELKDYLHLYLGCEIYADGFQVRTLTPLCLMEWNEHYYPFKPILRPLRSMTNEELQECGNMIHDFCADPELNHHRWKDFEMGLYPEQFHWLLSKHFDIFGLIDSGLAIDKSKL